MNRKDDHIHHALKQGVIHNDFDHIRFVHDALSGGNYQTVNLSSSFCGKAVPYPIYINAMTGGSEHGKALNIKLAKLANYFNIPLALGSISSALKDSQWISSFTVVRSHNRQGVILGNLGAEHSVNNAQKAVDLIQGNALQIHLNAVQELVMPEGDRDFSQWENNIKIMQASLKVPIVVKEVGFGFSKETLKKLKNLGIQYVDVSGKGGTNFSVIENARRPSHYTSFNDWGLSTVESLLEAQNIEGLSIYASGGIRNALDIVKALRLGATMVGMSGFFLKLVNQYSIDECIQKVQSLLDEVQSIMCALGVHDIKSLQSVPIILNESLRQYIQERGL